METNMSFAIGNFRGTGVVNGLPVFMKQMPAMRGGIMGVIDPAVAPAKFGRLVSAAPATPNTFVMGTPADTFPAGILVADPNIMQNDPAMNDIYFEGRPATIILFGPFQNAEYEPGLAEGRLGMTVWANKVTGEIGFEAIGTTPSSATYVQLNAFVYEKQDPNGTTIWLNQPIITLAASEARPVAVAPIASPVAGAVATGTQVLLSTATEGATIHYTLDGTTPDATDPIYVAGTTVISITAPVTIKAIAIKTGYTNSSVLTAAYTLTV